MKADELRSLPSEELLHRLDETKEEFFNLRFQLATGQLDNFKRVGLVKKDIAKIVTVLKEREIGIEIEPKDELRRTRKKKSEEGSRAQTEETDEADSPEEDS